MDAQPPPPPPPPAQAGEDGAGDGAAGLSISLDEDGRPMARGEVPARGIDYGFRAFPGLIGASDAAALRRACVAQRGRMSKAVRPVAEDGAYSSGDTFFVAADEMRWGRGDDGGGGREGEEDDEAGDLLARLAAEVFRFHVPPTATYDPATSGAEYWVLVLNDDDDDDDDEDDDDEDDEHVVVVVVVSLVAWRCTFERCIIRSWP